MNACCKIARMTEADLPEVARLESVCFAHPWSENGLRSGLDESRSVFLTAKSAGQLLGYLGMEYVLDEGYITNVAVFPESRRQGVAAALLTALLEEAKRLSLLTATLEVRVSNRPAQLLYQKFGFLSVGRRKNFYTTPTEDAMLMTVTLGGVET